MENITPLVAQQVLIMLILIITGFILSKSGVISEKGSKDIAGILLNIVTPALLIKAYQIDFDIAVVYDILVGFILSVLVHFIFIAICRIVFGSVKDEYKRIVLKFSNTYSNAGFMGIPLVAATLGDSGVVIASTYLATFNIIVWTHGLCLFGGDTKLISFKNLYKNPGIIGVSVALVLFFTGIRITGVVSESVGYIAALNTPLAMILLGTYLSSGNLKEALTNVSVYIISVLRLIILPLLVVLLFKLLSVDKDIAMALILPASCPCAAMCAIYAQKFGYNPGFPSQVVSVTTILSLVSLPLISYISYLIL